MSKRAVVPLESNPEVFTKFARQLGLLPAYGFADIYSLSNPELLGFLPRPVKAIILLFPISEATEVAKNSAPIANEDKDAVQKDKPEKTVIWYKQTIKNACGLYALLHCLSNNKGLLDGQCQLNKFLLNHPVENGKFEDDLTDEFIFNISEKYSSNFSEGDTRAPEAHEDVNLHFITFVEVSGKLWELDGRRASGAHKLGEASKDALDLADQKIIRERVQWYIDSANEKNKLQFSMLGLVPQ